ACVAQCARCGEIWEPIALPRGFVAIPCGHTARPLEHPCLGTHSYHPVSQREGCSSHGGEAVTKFAARLMRPWTSDSLRIAKTAGFDRAAISVGPPLLRTKLLHLTSRHLRHEALVAASRRDSGASLMHGAYLDPKAVAFQHGAKRSGGGRLVRVEP